MKETVKEDKASKRGWLTRLMGTGKKYTIPRIYLKNLAIANYGSCQMEIFIGGDGKHPLTITDYGNYFCASQRRLMVNSDTVLKIILLSECGSVLAVPEEEPWMTEKGIESFLGKSLRCALRDLMEEHLQTPKGKNMAERIEALKSEALVLRNKILSGEHGKIQEEITATKDYIEGLVNNTQRTYDYRQFLKKHLFAGLETVRTDSLPNTKIDCKYILLEAERKILEANNK